jgi:hypothetical protein
MKKILKYALAVQYILLALLALYHYNTPVFANNFAAWARIAFIVLFIAYGLFRVYRAYNDDFLEEEVGE